jgi:hypothetical protein
MSFDYDKVKSAVKALGVAADWKVFLEGFLSAYAFPATTFARLNTNELSKINKPIDIQRKIYFLHTMAIDPSSEFNILKKNDIGKIQAEFILIVNDTDVLAYERATGNTLKTTKADLYQKCEFFFSLLGIKKSAEFSVVAADRKAAEKLAELYGALKLNNPSVSDELIKSFICDFLFACFADSVGLVVSNGKLRAIVEQYTATSGTDLSNLFSNLFVALSSEKRNGMQGYFSDIHFLGAAAAKHEYNALAFNGKTRQAVLDALMVDWVTLTPEIIGTLIQSIVGTNGCGQYTSTENILKVIEPLFLNTLYEEFEKSKDNADKLKMLLERIQKIVVFDPASGTGNFLLVAYKELTAIADKVSAALTKEKTQIPHKNFIGIEEDAFACSISRLGFLIATYQTAVGRGVKNKEALEYAIKVCHSVRIENQNATRIDWESVCDGNAETYVVGNPSYKGSKKFGGAEKKDMARVFAGYKSFSELDYASCWFLLAAKYIAKHGCKSAFVTTNSLTQGQQVSLLWPKIFEQAVHIKFAHTAFKWINDAKNRTAVTVVIIGLVPNSDVASCELYSNTTVYYEKSINPYLVRCNESTIVAERNSPISGQLPEMVKGNMALYWSKHLLGRAQKVEAVIADSRIEKFLKKIIGGNELINGVERWCLWIKDENLEEAMKIPLIAEKVEAVRKARAGSKASSTKAHAEHPHRYREMRETTAGLSSLVIPEVSSENRCYLQADFVDSDTIVDSKNYVIYDCDLWVFGIIVSTMHNVWVRTVCGALEARIRYAPGMGYNTFPLPVLTDAQKALIEERVLRVFAERERHSEKTLAQLYNPNTMPLELEFAHVNLDKAIEICYSERDFDSDVARLDCLFKLYKQMEGTAKHG